MGKITSVIVCLFFLMFTGVSCSDDPADPVGPDTTTVKIPPFDIEKLNDTYGSIAPFDFYPLWGPYNVHDPSIIRDGEYFYCYNTDVGYGINVPPGIQIRKSKDLVDWT